MAVPSQTALNPSAMADHLLAGGAAAMPTDTLPALVSAPRHAGQLWTLKQRPSEKPFILMAANTEDLLALAQPKAADAARSLAGLHWPGALTLVLPMRADGFPQALVRAQKRGVRVQVVLENTYSTPWSQIHALACPAMHANAFSG